MNKKLLSVALSVLLVGSFACKKKEQQPVPQAPMPGQGMQMPPGHGMPPGQGGIMMPKGELQVVVPETVKGKWKAVRLVVEDKATRKAQEHVVNLHSELKIPNSNMKVVVGEFLPDFRMDVGTITSASNNANNPAVGIKVFENGKQIFPDNGKWGWLYANFPAIHPFEHPKVGLILKEGLKKG